MSRVLFELQNNIKNLRQQLHDRIHLAFLNHQSYLCVKGATSPFQQISSNIQLETQNIQTRAQKYISPKNRLKQHSQATHLHKINTRIEQKLRNLSQIFEKRSQNHLNYLITRQIQSEEECVRRDRLTEYEQKIYDQRRLISDKEVFTQSLLRPKKLRPENMNSEEYQETRTLEKLQEQKSKIAGLQEEVRSLQDFRKKVWESSLKNSRGVANTVISKRQMDVSGKIKSEDLQRTKANSLETVNMSNMNNMCGEKQQKTFDEEEVNGEIPASTTSNEAKVGQKGVGLGECEEEREREVMGCYSVKIERLMESYEKKARAEEVKEKYKKVSELMETIQKKKADNAGKSKEWNELMRENGHMKAQLKKTQQLYLTIQSAHTQSLKPLAQ